MYFEVFKDILINVNRCELPGIFLFVRDFCVKFLILIRATIHKPNCVTVQFSQKYISPYAFMYIHTGQWKDNSQYYQNRAYRHNIVSFWLTMTQSKGKNFSGQTLWLQWTDPCTEKFLRFQKCFNPKFWSEELWRISLAAWTNSVALK